MGRWFDEADLSLIDLKLADVELQATNNDDLVRKLPQISLNAIGDLSYFSSIDPFSDEYKKAILGVHREIIGKHYSTKDEGLPTINPGYERDWPYPWGTKSPETVARFLIAYGFLIKTAALPPHARILEVGCGMGSLTWNLARMGYRVDALDPNEVQCSCVREATRHFPMPPNVVAMTLDEWLTEKSERHAYKYDAVIFFESFHHIADHYKCLRRIIDDHLEVDGKLLLAAEPIVAQQCDWIPYPWGPRLDGESLRAMRRWGWLELGFIEDYVRELFARLGLSYANAQCEEALPWSRVVIGQAKQISAPDHEDDGARYDARIEDGVHFASAGMPRFIKKFSGLGGREPWGRWSIGDKVIFEFERNLPGNFTLLLEFAEVFGPNINKKIQVVAGDVSASDTLMQIGHKQIYTFDFKAVETSTIKILIPHPARPKDIVELCNEDSRKLGLALISMKII
jgi:SAM-dependent methyltransferase